ncbi:tetratricopeptide repeat protein [Parabacteroides merdae]|nr:tetratricopeptide repeat protein [Parabacteroides merdae]
MKTQILEATILAFIIFFSCHQANQQHPILEQAEKVMSEHPDSALFLLEQVTALEKMPERDYATWCLLITEARDKNYIEHTSDSLINVAIQYFEKKKDINRLAEAYYCQGRVLSELSVSEEALTAYLKAKELVRETSDRDLEARINNHLGTLYWENGRTEKSLSCYKEAYRNYEMEQNKIGMTNTLRNIGKSMHGLEKLDSAYFYLSKAIQLAEQGQIDSQMTHLLSSIGSVCAEKGEYEKALTYNKASLSYPMRKNMLCARYFAIGRLYQNLQKTDSALLYAEKALMGTDLYIECSANRLLYTIYVKEQDYKKACTYNERYLLLRDSIEQVYRPQKLAKVEALYNKERLVGKQKQQMHEARSRQDFLLICFLCACLAIGIVYVIMFQTISKHKLKNKEIQKLLQKNENLLLSDKQEMEKKDIALQTIQKQLEENQLLIDSLTEKIQTLENDNLSQLEIYKQQQEEANIEQSKLLKEKETILKQKEELISNKDILLREKDAQLKSISAKNGKLEQRILLSIKEKEELERQRSVLSQELDANVKAQKQLSLDWESLRLQQEEQLRKEQEVAGELKQKSRMYEAWIQKLIHQDEFLLNLSDNRQQLYPLNFNKDVFYEHFSPVFPGFVEYLFIQYKLDERELLICCLVKLGVKTGKIATILNLAPDTITKQKAEIKEKYFNVSEKQSLDRFLEKLLW